MPLRPITEDSAERICCLALARYGLGKTSLIRTALGQEYGGKDENGADVWNQVTETGDKVCVLSAESGLLAIRDLVKSKRVEGFEIGSLAEFKEAYQLLSTDQRMKDRYTWVFIDSLTEIAARCEEVMKAKYPDPSKTFRMWDDYSNTMITTVKGFRDMKEYNVVFTCLITEDKDDLNRRFFAPAVAGKGLKEKLPSFFDEVFYLSTTADSEGGEHRVFYCDVVNEYPAKDRSGKLRRIEKPNLLYIKNKILNGCEQSAA